MKKSKKYSISLLVILISVPIFAANLNPVSGQDDVELSIIVTGQQAPAVEGVINDFLSSDLGDGVSGVTVVTSGERAEDQLSYLINLMNSEDDEFDVLGLDVIWPAQFAENGWIEELSSSDYGVTSDEMNDYSSGMVQASTYDGKIWAYPSFLNSGVLF